MKSIRPRLAESSTLLRAGIAKNLITRLSIGSKSKSWFTPQIIYWKSDEYITYKIQQTIVFTVL